MYLYTMASSSETKKHKMFSKNQVRISSKGRSIKTPKNVLTTSDEEPPIKKIKPSSISEKMNKLKVLAEQLELKKATTLPKGKESTAGLGSNSKTSSDHTSQLEEFESFSDQSNKKMITKSSQKDKSAAAAALGSESSSAIILQSNESETFSNQSNQKKIINSSKEEHYAINVDPSVGTRSEKSTLTHCQSHGTDSPASKELYGKGLEKNSLINANFLNNSSRTETFLDIPVINFPPEACADSGEIQKRLETIETKVDKICDQNNEILQILRARYSTDQLANRLYQNLDGYPIDSIEQFRHLDDEANKQERQTVELPLTVLYSPDLKIRQHIKEQFY
ncbi:uncharacterized protein LOC127284593 [Leptopilina boulardi]|uniref:uncharacterized protein LOC127284593 n=1 Tax=Leptopilina boulardi TaxID=63433 RepID=UPI0021F5842D|nr:uncharacterized protein LOC127284593 [Leptopilina boulardi]